MQRAFIFLGFVFGVTLLSVSAQAACGGGGFKRVSQETTSEYRVQEVSSSNLDKLQRDVDKAQAKLDNCVGDCDSERRKLAEANAKLARRTAGN